MNNHYEYKGKATSQIVYSPSGFHQNSHYIKATEPLKGRDLNDRELLKEQFYLSRFLRIMEANTAVPTLPDPSLLQAIKK